MTTVIEVQKNEQIAGEVYARVTDIYAAQTRTCIVTAQGIRRGTTQLRRIENGRGPTDKVTAPNLYQEVEQMKLALAAQKETRIWSGIVQDKLTEGQVPVSLMIAMNNDLGAPGGAQGIDFKGFAAKLGITVPAEGAQPMLNSGATGPGSRLGTNQPASGSHPVYN